MPFTTYIPCQALQPFVKSLAISENEAAGSYKILPGTSIVMGFQFSGKLSYTSNNSAIPLSQAGITGLMDSYRVFSNTPQTGSVLVMFSESGAAAFFKTPLHEIFGQSLSLDDLVLRSQMDVVVEKLSLAKTNEQRIAEVEAFLLSQLAPQPPDEMVTLAITLIRRHKGALKITALAEKLGISHSRFEKRFRKVVGASPKKFASIVRVGTLVAAAPQKNGLLHLALDAGYFDQAHFIKDFKSFTGQTPEQFFGNK